MPDKIPKRLNPPSFFLAARLKHRAFKCDLWRGPLGLAHPVPLVLALTVPGVATAPALAGGITAQITLNVSPRPSCSMTTSGLAYDFTGLEIGKPKTLSARYTVKCDRTANVTMTSLWDGQKLAGKTYTFPDNNDTVEVMFCYAGDANRCWASDAGAWSIDERAVDLRLTYTAHSAESDHVRLGILQLSYE